MSPRVLLRALRARWLLSAGCLTLAVLAVAAGVLGPTYVTAATASLTSVRVDEATPATVGLSWRLHPSPATAQVPSRALEVGREAGDAVIDSAQFAPARSSIVREQVDLDASTLTRATIRAVPGQCRLLAVEGDCPDAPGEVLVSRADVALGDFEVGSAIRLLTGRASRLRVVGVYTPPDPGSDFWFDPSRYQSVPAGVGVKGDIPYQPADFLTVPGTFAAYGDATWTVQVDRAVVPRGLTPELLDAAATTAATERERQSLSVDGGILGPAAETELDAVAAEVTVERRTAVNTVLPASASLVAVALLLLFRLLSAAADQRRPGIALLKLRGVRGAALWTQGAGESLLLLLLAVPFGVLGGWGAVVGLSRAWLQPGTQVSLGVAPLAAAGAVTLVGLITSVWAVSAVLREPLLRQLGSERRPTAATRVLVAGRTVVGLVGAIAYLAVLRGDEGRSPGVIDLLMPLALASAFALGVAFLTGMAATRHAARHRGGHLTGWLVARRLARRQDGVAWVLPLAVSLAVTVFSAGAWAAAATWRQSVAATIVGADMAYPTVLSPARALALTHQVDPDGRWVMAAARYRQPGTTDRIFVDGERLARVGAWPSSWTPGTDAGGVTEGITSRTDPLRLQGKRVALTARSAVAEGDPPFVTVVARDSDGRTHQAFLGPYAERSTTQQGSLRGCATGCDLITLQVTGIAGTPLAARLDLEFLALAVDGQPADAGFTDGASRWRPAVDDATVEPVLEVLPAPDGLRIHLDTTGSAQLPGVTTTDVPDVRPVAVGPDVRLADSPVLDGGELMVEGAGDHLVPVDVVTTAASLPVVGTDGVLGDLPTFLRDGATETLQVEVLVLARADTPTDVLGVLNSRGVDTTAGRRLSGEQRVLDNDAYALSLRLYLVVAVSVLALASVGVLAGMAVQARRRRREAAALRVSGIRQRTVTAASVFELGVVFGAAGLAGVVAGVLAEDAVVGVISLGPAAGGLPSIQAGIDGLHVAAISGAVLAATSILACLAGWSVVRRVRPAELRQDDD